MLIEFIETLTNIFLWTFIILEFWLEFFKINYVLAIKDTDTL